MTQIITLLTDFGIQDGYVASMKGVIMGICPEARFVDISHLIPPQDVRSAAFVLSTVYRDFPVGTIHLAVVDPGVGTDRKALAIETEHCLLVGPDNGLFSWILKREDKWEARSVENTAYLRSPVSRTFHGRDVFAPVAAHLANGVRIHSLGPSCIPLIARWCSFSRHKGGLYGEVIHIDRFGNIITNVTGEDLKDFDFISQWTIDVGGHIISEFVSIYAQATPGSPAALIGSSGHLEIALNQGDAARSLGIHSGDPVRVTPQTSP